MTTTKRTRAAVLLLACALAWGGCSEDGDKVCWDCPPPPAPYPPASTPDQLALNYSRCFHDQNHDEFLVATDWTFTLPLNRTAVQLYGWPRDAMTYDEVTGAVANLFSGEAVTRPGGLVVPGAEGMDFNVFQQEAAWADTTLGEPAEPAKWAPFRIDAVVQLGWGNLRIVGLLDFFVKEWLPPTDSPLEPHWAVVRIVDRTVPSGGKRVAEYTSWSELMVMYAAPPDTVAAP